MLQELLFWQLECYERCLKKMGAELCTLGGNYGVQLIFEELYWIDQLAIAQKYHREMGFVSGTLKGVNIIWMALDTLCKERTRRTRQQYYTTRRDGYSSIERLEYWNCYYGSSARKMLLHTMEIDENYLHHILFYESLLTPYLSCSFTIILKKYTQHTFMFAITSVIWSLVSQLFLCRMRLRFKYDDDKSRIYFYYKSHLYNPLNAM